jgi:hypothetical protein
MNGRLRQYESKKIYWPSLKKWMQRKFGSNSRFYHQVPIILETKGRKIVIQPSWYDILVVDGEIESLEFTRSGVLLKKRMNRICCVEIKASEKEGGSFGAFTIGECYAASVALRTGFFRYSFVYVSHKGNRSYPTELPQSEQFLRDILAFPQYKLYFYKPLYEKYVSGSKAKTISRKKDRSALERKLDRTLLRIMEVHSSVR